jgi:hypothetical protein
MKKFDISQFSLDPVDKNKPYHSVCFKDEKECQQFCELLNEYDLINTEFDRLKQLIEQLDPESGPDRVMITAPAGLIQEGQALLIVLQAVISQGGTIDERWRFVVCEPGSIDVMCQDLDEEAQRHIAHLDNSEMGAIGLN